MELLLDTHILIAMVEENIGTLPRPMQSVLAAPESVLMASVASIWEIAIKTRLGKLRLGTAPGDFPDAMFILGIELTSIELAHVVAELETETLTRDPFDRLLLAQCQVEGMRLVTLDRALVGNPLAWRES